MILIVNFMSTLNKLIIKIIIVITIIIIIMIIIIIIDMPTLKLRIIVIIILSTNRAGKILPTARTTKN